MKTSKNMLFFVFLHLFSLYASQGNPHDCLVSEWSVWSECSEKCLVGEKTQKRTILKRATDIFAKPCPKNLTHSVKCGIRNNGCDTFCVKETGNCGCVNGFTLDVDQKTCIDRNECEKSFGRGLCSHMCTNAHGSYKCSCYRGFSLLPDGHDCHFNSSSRPCNRVTHMYDEEGKCVCKNKLSGLNCNRNHALCPNTVPTCGSSELCVTFIHAYKQCVSKIITLPILFSIPFENFDTDFHYEIEEYITEVLEGKESRNFHEIFSTRKRRASSDVGYYVEGSEPIKVKSYTYVQYAVLDIEQDFTPVAATNLCSKFEGNSIHCLNNKECNLLKSAGIQCLFVYQPQFEKHTATESKSAKPWIIVVVCIVVFIIIVGILTLILRKRGFSFKQLTSTRRQETNQNTDNLLLTVAHSCPPPPYSVGNNLPNSETFDIPIFESGSTTSQASDGDRHLYESVENLKLKMEEMYMPMDSKMKKGAKQLVVELPPYEPRYTECSIPVKQTDDGENDLINEDKKEVHYAVPTNNRLARPKSESDDDE